MKKPAPMAARIREVVAKRVAALPLSAREIERELDWGHGSVSNMLRGRTEITLRHIEALAPVLGSTPLELLEEIYEKPVVGGVGQTGLPPELQSAIVQCVREVLRDEMSRAIAGAMPGAEDPQSQDQP